MENEQNDTFRKLLDQMMIMNRNLETASTAINNLNIQLSSTKFEPAAKGNRAAVNYPPTNAAAGSETSENSKQAPTVTNSFADDSGDQATRALGYINWNSSHETLKEEMLINITTIREALDKTFPGCLVSKRTALGYDGGDGEYQSKHKAISNSAAARISFYNLITQKTYKVAKETRFPLDAVCVNVNLPLIKQEIDFLNKLNTPPTSGVIDRFMMIAEKHMHSSASFETEHGLIWM